MVSLWAASIPSTSRVGSASAYPRACASASTSSNGRPPDCISVRMKLPVPLMMPARDRIRLPASPSRMFLITGIAPATAASNAMITPAARAASKTSLPCRAMRALLAVTTCLPRWMARSTRSRAASVPPTSSTITSMAASSTTERASPVRSKPAASHARGRPGSRTATRVTSIARPARRAISPALRRSTLTVPAPTVPSPSTPMRIGSNRVPPSGKQPGGNYPPDAGPDTDHPPGSPSPRRRARLPKPATPVGPASRAARGGTREPPEPPDHGRPPDLHRSPYPPRTNGASPSGSPEA